MYFKIVLAGITVFLVFRMLSFVVKTFPFPIKVKHFSGYMLPLAELLSWLGFALWCLHLIYYAEAYSTLIVFGALIVLIIAPAWFLIRDFLYGLLLKMQGKIEIDSKIEIGDLKGITTKADYFTFELKTKEGNNITIPYNKVRSEVITKSAANIYLEKQFISFQISSRNDGNKLKTQLKKILINAPWVAASQEPLIESVNYDGTHYTIDAIVYVLKKEHVENIKDYVSKNFDSEV